METLYYTTMHLEASQASFLSETNVYLSGVYLLFWAAILDLASRWTPIHNFNTINEFVAPNLVGLEVFL